MLFVTGITGRLGAALLPKIMKKKLRVIVRDAIESVKLSKKIDIKIADITDEKAMEEACEGVDTVIHMASIVDYSLPWPLLYDKNVNGTKALLNACVKKKVRNFIYISSTSVYGKGVKKGMKRGLISETSPLEPTDNYGKSKVLAEQEVLGMKDKMKVVILRPSMMYGPGFTEGYLDVAKKIKKGKMAILGDGKNKVPIVHCNDVAEAITSVLGSVEKHSKKVQSGAVYNVSHPNPPTQEAVYRMAADALGVPVPKEHTSVEKARIYARLRSIFNRRKSSQMMEYIDKLSSDRVFDVSRIGREVGFKKYTDHKKGIREAVKSFNLG